MDWIPNWLLEWGKDLLMVGVAGAGLWGIIQHKAKVHLYPSEYEKEVLSDLKELRQLLEWLFIQEPWLEESKEKKQVNSYKAEDQAFLWKKLYRDWIRHSESVECHTTSEYLDEINKSIGLIREYGIKKALRIRREQITDPYQMIMKLRTSKEQKKGDSKIA